MKYIFKGCNLVIKESSSPQLFEVDYYIVINNGVTGLSLTPSRYRGIPEKK